MNRKQIDSLVRWLIAAASELDHGECSVTVKVRHGRVQQILKNLTRSELPTNQTAIEQSRN